MGQRDGDSLAADYATAKQQGRGTDMGRIAKQLAALGLDVKGKPAAEPKAAAAAERRASKPAADKPPAGRESPADRKRTTDSHGPGPGSRA